MNIELMKKKRKELGMTQQDLADKCGVSKNTVYNYENGRVEPTKENIEKISKALGVSEFDLLLENEPLELVNDEYEEILDLLEENMRLKIKNFLIKKYKNFSTKSIDYEKVSKSLLYILKYITGKRILYSDKIEKVIFFDTTSTNNPVYDFVIIELYILNTISSIENIEKSNSLLIEVNSFINVLNAEKINIRLEIENKKLKETEIEIIGELYKFLETIKTNNLNKETLDKEEYYFLKLSYDKANDILNTYTFQHEQIDKNFKKELDSEYKKGKTKYLKWLENNKSNTTDKKNLKDLSDEELTSLIENKLDKKDDLTDEEIDNLEVLSNELLDRMSNIANKNIKNNKEGGSDE